MTLQCVCLAGLLLIAPVIRAKWSNYHLPWACSVVHDEGSLVGACSIFDRTRVLVSSDNFNQDVKLLNNQVVKYYEVIQNLHVGAGSNVMDIQRIKSVKPPASATTRRAKSLYIASHQIKDRGQDKKWEYVSSPIDDLSRGSSVEYDQYGIAFSTGILSVQIPFVWTRYIKPILIPSDASRKTEDYIYQHDAALDPITDSCVTYSWSQKTNKIRYHQVTYIPTEDCVGLFCMWNLSTCDLFPRKPYLTCFKSVTYQDVCPNARGAALYCPEYSKSVFAVLTTAPSCGQRHMPGVYTTLPLLIELFETIFGVTFNVNDRPQYEPLELEQGYSPWG